MENNDPFKLLLLIALLFVFVFVPFVCDTPVKAAYSTSNTTASASVSQELTIIVLPALEHAVVSAEQTGGYDSTYLLALRANTAWGFDYSVDSNTQAPLCQSSASEGQRNLNDNFQFVQIDCTQPWSWADTNIDQTLTYTITPRLGDAS